MPPLFLAVMWARPKPEIPTETAEIYMTLCEKGGTISGQKRFAANTGTSRRKLRPNHRFFAPRLSISGSARQNSRVAEQVVRNLHVAQLPTIEWQRPLAHLDHAWG